MSSATISPKPAAIKAFYDNRDRIHKQGVTNEMGVREPFKILLDATARQAGWTLLTEQTEVGQGRNIRPDGVLRDDFRIPRGYWEAKDTRDDLNAEIDKKIARGYPTSNIIFDDTQRAVLYQGGGRVGTYDLSKADDVVLLLTRFLSYTEPVIEGFEKAVAAFKEQTPMLASGLLELIAGAHKGNKRFQTAYGEFYELCKNALNPNISRDAVDEMLIQHLLTERLMRTVFDNADFTRRNAIAGEVEKVIDALTSQNFSRREFLGQLDYFYEAIEAAAKTLRGFAERQTFIKREYHSSEHLNYDIPACQSSASCAYFFLA